MTTRGITISAVTPIKYPKWYRQCNIDDHKKILKESNCQPEYDGSDIQSTSRAGLVESFSNYGQRVEQWLIEKEKNMGSGCCGGNSSSCSSDSNPVSNDTPTQDGCTNDAATCDNDPCCKKDN